MKHILLLTLFLLQTLSANTIRLRGVDYPDIKKSEGIMIWVRDDKTYFSDSGPRTSVEIINTCKEWRKRGTEPAIRFLLYPTIPSNNDIGSVIELLKKLNENKIPIDIMIITEDDPPADLITNKKIDKDSEPAKK